MGNFQLFCAQTLEPERLGTKELKMAYVYHPFDGRVRSHMVKHSGKCAMTTVGVVSDVVPCQNGGRTFGEIFSRCEWCLCMFDGI